MNKPRWIPGVLLVAPSMLAMAFLLFWMNTGIHQNYGVWVNQVAQYPSDNRMRRLALDFIDSTYAWKMRIWGASRISPLDGMLQVFVPQGKFRMGGSSKFPPVPLHSVYLDAFWIDRTEVSRKMYAQCVLDGVCSLPAKVDSIKTYLAQENLLNLPAVYVTWEDALTYCQWVGRRLPTEAEWEKAARGKDRRVYPWGSDKPNPNLLNHDNWIGAAQPVHRFPFGASPYGAINMAGNVREWVSDWFDENADWQDGAVNPTGPVEGKKRILRGGGYSDSNRQVRLNNRFWHIPYSAGINRGFRCAQDA